MKTWLKVLVIAAAVAAVAIGALIGLRPLLSRREGVHYLTRPVTFADISATVNETGTINPVNQVTVGSEVSGTIKSLGADFNSRVKKGQVLALLDPTTYKAAVESATANLALARANLSSAEVNVVKAKDQLELAKLTEQRDEALLQKAFIPQSQMDTERTAADTAHQDYLAAQAAVQVAQAQVSVASGQLAQAQYNLSRTVITSPIDGIVMARNVSVGQTVAASLQTPTLFVLATSLTDMQVDTSVDEADVGSVHEGQTAEITVTAYPNVVFSGTVSQVRVNPSVVQNVVTYDAVVVVHDASGRLLPGMTAQVTIDVGKRTNVLAVPLAALLYRPLAAQGGSAGFGPAGGGAFGAGVMQSGASTGTPVAGAPGSQVTVWALRNEHPSPVQVVIGLSDGKNVEISSGDLSAGDRIIVAQRRGPGASASQESAPAGRASAMNTPRQGQ